MECYFKVPATMPHSVIISLKEGERPLDKRGALCAISPEEVRHAIMAAIARQQRRRGVGSPGGVVPQSPQLHGDLPGPCHRGGAPPSGDATPREHGKRPRGHEQDIVAACLRKLFVSVTRSLGPTGGARPLLPTSPPNTEKRGWPRGAKESASPLWTPR